MVSPFYRRAAAGALPAAGALLLLLGAPAGLHAQQAPPPAPDPVAPVVPAQPDLPAPEAPAALESIEVTSHRLNEARAGIETQIGASVYTIDAAAIAAMPGGDNSLLNQAVMQAPDVAQDSFGQFHVRGEHNGLQYRLNGIILPEGISGFGQSLDPRLISSLQLITGALPAEYGLRTAGIIDLSTRSGALDPGGTLSLYGGSHGTVQPSINYGGAGERLHYFVSADALVNRLGIESPDGSATPLHDRTRQAHAFAYLEDVIDGSDRLSLILSQSSGGFQIPDRRGQQPALGLSLGGVTAFPSEALDETQHEQTQFAVLGWQYAAGALDLQTAFTVRNSILQFTPDPLGDLLFNGISQSAHKRNLAYDWQLDSAWQLGAGHTLRAGSFVQRDRSDSQTQSLVLDTSTDPLGVPTTISEAGGKAETIGSLYMQDEWQLDSVLTLNYGLRLDAYAAYRAEHQLSPRANLVWKATPATTVHAGYARYFSPPPFELVGAESVARFLNTSAAPAITTADTPLAERAHYLDIGVLQNLSQQLSLGLDSYFKRSAHLVDEGQFGAPIILTPFNYREGRQYGAELSLNYANQYASAYANLAWQSATGKGIESSQFNFAPAQLAYIGSHYIDLDHEQKFTASGGASYRAGALRLSADALLGSGLRASLLLPDGVTTIPNGTHLPYYLQLNLGASREFALSGKDTLTLRADCINALDRQYEIRNGTGVGVGAPQFGARRGFFLGVARSF